MFFQKEFFSVNCFQKKIFLGTLFRKFSFHEKICFWNYLILNYFFLKEIIFQNFNSFRKNVSCKFYAFLEKTFGKKTHIDNFSLLKIKNEFIWLLCTFWWLSTSLLKKSQKTRKTENNLIWNIPPFSSFLLGNVIFT